MKNIILCKNIELQYWKIASKWFRCKNDFETIEKCLILEWLRKTDQNDRNKGQEHDESGRTIVLAEYFFLNLNRRWHSVQIWKYFTDNPRLSIDNPCYIIWIISIPISRSNKWFNCEAMILGKIFNIPEYVGAAGNLARHSAKEQASSWIRIEEK